MYVCISLQAEYMREMLGSSSGYEHAVLQTGEEERNIFSCGFYQTKRAGSVPSFIIFLWLDDSVCFKEGNEV